MPQRSTLLRHGSKNGFCQDMSQEIVEQLRPQIFDEHPSNMLCYVADIEAWSKQEIVTERSVQFMNVEKIGRCRWQCCGSLRQFWLTQNCLHTAATSRAAWPCGRPLKCSHMWSSGRRSVQHLRSCTQKRRMNVIPDLVERLHV